MTKYRVIKTNDYVGWHNLFNEKSLYHKRALSKVVWEKEMTIGEIRELAFDYMGILFDSVEEIGRIIDYIEREGEELWSPLGSDECIFIKEVREDE